jgi:putative ABC transport system permease protein
MAEGRNFSRDYPSDGNKCLINETAARLFKYNASLGKKIKTYKGDYEVIGVIKDYVVSSVHSPIEPHLYILLQDSLLNDKVYTVKFANGKEKEAMKIAKEEFGKFFPEDAFEFKNIQVLIRNENAVKAWKSFRKICGLIALITLIISSIGLFGLMLFLAKRKMKEVGIRKVLGFSTSSLYVTLSSGFIKLMSLSIVIAWPAGYYYYQILPGADKYGLQIWEFIASTAIILIVALATITWQILKAIKVRPVEILKDE